MGARLNIEWFLRSQLAPSQHVAPCTLVTRQPRRVTFVHWRLTETSLKIVGRTTLARMTARSHMQTLRQCFHCGGASMVPARDKLPR